MFAVETGKRKKEFCNVIQRSQGAVDVRYWAKAEVRF